MIPSNGSEPANCPPDVLVVDDDPDVVRGLARILSLRGIPVRSATSGHEALELASQRSPAVMLTDIVMPGLNGIDTARELKKRNPDVAIIFMTGYSDLENQANEEGPVAVMIKPIDFAKLVETLGSLGFPA